MTINAHRIPVSRLEARDLIVGYGKARRAIDRDAVVVKENDQLSKSQVPGKRNRFVADAFHKAPVSGNDIGVMIDYLVTDARIEHALCQCHADGVGETLSKGTRRGFDSGRMTKFGMSRRFGTQLAKVL